MQLAPLTVIQREISILPPPSFDWGGGDPDDAVGEIDDGLVDEFKSLNSIAAVAYIIATVEWLYWYVRPRLDAECSRDFEEYIVAMWVWECDLPRKIPPAPYLPRDRKSGTQTVFEDAVEIGLESISNGINSVPDHETDVDAAFMTQLCEYVLPKKSGFRKWKTAVLGRLRAQFPSDGAHYDSVHVSRSVFDTDLKSDQIDNEAACSELIASATLSSDNRYLPLKLAPLKR